MSFVPDLYYMSSVLHSVQVTLLLKGANHHGNVGFILKLSIDTYKQG